MAFKDFNKLKLLLFSTENTLNNIIVVRGFYNYYKLLKQNKSYCICWISMEHPVYLKTGLEADIEY